MQPPSSNAYGGAGPLILGVTWAETILATVFFSMRCWATLVLPESTGWDQAKRWDLLWSFITYCTSIVSQVLITISILYGTGNQITILDYPDLVQNVKYSWIGQEVGIMAVLFGKIAVIALLFKIQRCVRPKLPILLHFIWISNLLINVEQIALMNSQCTPARKLWASHVPGTCDGRGRSSHAGFFQGAWSAASDLVLASYPIYVFWELQMPKLRKVTLCLLFGGGFIIVIAGTVKTVYIKLTPETTDVTYSIYPLLLATYTEMWLTLILGCLPTLRPFFTKGGMITSSHTSKSKASQSFEDYSLKSYRSRFNEPAYPQPTRSKGMAMHEPSGSEEEILRHADGIKVTTSYTVKYGMDAVDSYNAV